MFAQCIERVALSLLCCCLIVSLQHCAGVGFPNRLATNSPCSLLRDLEWPCQMKSVLGKNVSGSDGLLMYMGEYNCTLRLQQCRPGTCYSFRDMTTLISPSPSLALTQGFFSDIQIVRGAKDLTRTTEGVSFHADAKEIILRYSTVTCAEFWRYRDSYGVQTCRFPLEAVTVVDSDVPTSLPCKNSG